MTKLESLKNSLENGKQLTAAQITSQFKLANPTAAISSLREQGFAVYANTKTNSHGERVVKYRIGRPTRAVVAAGYKVLGSY